MKKNNIKHYIFLTYLVFSLLTFIVNPFPSINYLIRDLLCLDMEGPQPNIFVIGIDDKSLDSIGPWQTWDRSVMARLIKLLNADEETRPYAIGIDVMYFGATETDEPLIEASEQWDNLVFASKLDYTEALLNNADGSYFIDNMHLERIQLPFPPLDTLSAHGYTNVFLDSDGFVRRVPLSVETEEGIYHNFAYSIYRTYAEHAGFTPVLPADSQNGMFLIPYGAKNGAYYSGISFTDVLNGAIPANLFKDSIVLIGAYAPGMLDSYYTPVDRSTPMYGIEINANIVQALCTGKSLNEVPVLIQLFLMAAVLLVSFYFYQKDTMVKNTALLISTAGYLVLTAGLSRVGYILEPLYIPLASGILYISMIITSYLKERRDRLMTLNTFKRYVSPEVADHLIKEGNDSLLHPHSIRRHIAVMFVDIRGFTPLSESLEPEEVADILNEYLSLTSSCIFSNGGTVDKFIGDATMAIFNAPNELPDYVFRAVKAGLDIAGGGDALSGTFREKYGKEVRFGIGINCGEAVVGSIGAPFRMDYTAIGDTVNTAARLESNAGRGQVLVSEEVYLALKDRIAFSPVGELSLKGKSKPVKVYEATSLL